ncbi:chemotaxis protein CheA [Ignavibacterium sp.]|uniref:chemotaxis protein CheA n=1 Tax=Ignavibacterium sp. TaxID=2651167 RepID=UPI002205E5A4|nr:chemotaxis protein CheA [Ignavibacterium sp.]BDQ02869.1 MAG: chemotaxis protein A [Ignavibacterium sp.]
MSKSEINPMLTDPEMKEIVDSFLIESKEIIDSLDVDLIELEKNPTDENLLNKVFRSFHTIKGSSGFLNLNKLTSLTHRCEDILNKLRKKEASLDSMVMDSILLGYDKMKELLNSIETNHNEDVEIENVIQKLQTTISKLGNKNKELIQIVETQKSKRGRKKKTEEKILVEAKKDLAVTKVEETSKQVQSEEQKSETENTNQENKKADNSIRVDVEKLDELLNMVSELVLGRNRLAQINLEVSREFEGTQLARELEDTTKLIDMMTNELQQLVMKTRMVKIGKVFNKYPRLVRDLSKTANKKINLIIEGEETELDKTLIEEINDPLVHILRNSIDHGIEKEEDRIKAGKNPVGTIKLNAEHEGNNIIITIEDDGKGIDPEVIKSKAISKGLISQQKADELSKQDLLNLIFLPGFSTAEVVTNISGRGVGMDVVKTNVTKLRGMINLESTVGVGTKIQIKLPLTLAIISGMIVKVDKEQFVIPLNSVIEVIRVHSENVYSINNKPVIKLRDRIIPLVSLRQVVLNQTEQSENNIWQYVVIVGLAERQVGIEVDELLGQKEIVIKSLGSYIGRVPGIAGSTIMGDGTVILILDINELINKTQHDK